MALKKTIIEDNGIATEYHKIKRIEVTDKIKEEYYVISIDVSSFISEELRQKSNTNSVIIRQYGFRVVAADVENKGIYEIAYTELKKQKDFVDAEDC